MNVNFRERIEISYSIIVLASVADNRIVMWHLSFFQTIAQIRAIPRVINLPMTIVLITNMTVIVKKYPQNNFISHYC